MPLCAMYPKDTFRPLNFGTLAGGKMCEIYKKCVVDPSSSVHETVSIW